MLKLSSSHMNERAGTFENKHWLIAGPTETLAHNLQDDNGKIITTHFEHYKVEVTAVSGYCKSDEKFLKVKSYQKCKILLL